MQTNKWRGLLVLTAVLLLMPMWAQAVTFKIATLAPDGTTWMKEMRAAAKEVKKRTDGRVKIRFYPGGVMGTDAAVLKKMRFGQLHGGAVSGLGLALAHPDSIIYSLPFQFRNREEVRHVRAQLDDELHSRLLEKGYLIAGISDGGFIYLMSNQAISDLSSLRSVKLWSPEGDNLTRTVYNEMQVTPVVLPTGDIYTGLQTGLIDSVTATNVGAVAFQWFTKLKYITDAPLGYIYGALVFDAKRVNKLKPEDRKVLLEVTSETFARLSDSVWESEQQARKTLIDEGLQMVNTSPEEVSKLRALADTAVTKMSRNGQLDPELLARVRDILKAYRAN